VGRPGSQTNSPYSCDTTRETMCKPPEIGCRNKITHFHTRHRVRPWVGHSYDEHFFSCTYVKEVMTGQPPKGPVVYSLRNGNAHYIGATVDLGRRIEQHNTSRVGGAHRTARRGPGWRCTWYVDGFSSFQQSLQFEYALKRETRAFGYTPAARSRAVRSLIDRWMMQHDAPGLFVRQRFA